MLTVPVHAVVAAVWLSGFVVYGLGILNHTVIAGLVHENSALRRPLDLNGEANLPAWFSSSMLLLSAFLLLVTARVTKRIDRREANRWLLLATIFLYLSLDEAGHIHELASHIFGDLKEISGLLYFSWVAIAIPVVLAGGIYFLPFVFRLKARLRWSIILSGMIFVGGAVGLEMLNGLLRTLGAPPAWLTTTMVIEEGMEIFGVLLFITTLLHHLADIAPRLVVNAVRGGKSSAQAETAARDQAS